MDIDGQDIFTLTVPEIVLIIVLCIERFLELSAL
jgi:hypothetical protein